MIKNELHKLAYISAPTYLCSQQILTYWHNEWIVVIAEEQNSAIPLNRSERRCQLAIRCKRNRRLRKKRANFVLNLCTHNRKVVLTEAPEGSIKRIWMATIRWNLTVHPKATRVSSDYGQHRTSDVRWTFRTSNRTTQVDKCMSECDRWRRIWIVMLELETAAVSGRFA